MAKKKPTRTKTGGRSSATRRAAKPAKKTRAKTSSKTSKKVATKSAKKVASKPARKTKKKVTKTSKKAARKVTRKGTKPGAKKAMRKKAPSTKKVATKPASAPDGGADAGKKTGRKGITIVKPKPARRSSSSPTSITIPKFGSGILGPGAPKRKPLIPSGPAAADKSTDADEAKRLKKTPFKKRELQKFRDILLRKRAELIGDVSTMENEALRSESGGTSHLPQHMAEQGSDTYDQAISLDLAAADRQLIREIDDALRRISDGTYGICELTGRPIRPDRLEELPWARYSIDAARELERRKS